MSTTRSAQATDVTNITIPTSELIGQLADIHSIRMEQIIEIARQVHPDMRIVSTFQEEEGMQKVDKIIYLLPDKREPRIMTISSETGKVIKDRPYHLHDPQNIIPLEKLLVDLRKKFDITRIVRTRMVYRDGQDVRLIIYATKQKQQRILTVNALTGTVISDNPRNL